MFTDQTSTQTELRSGDTQSNILPTVTRQLSTFRVDDVTSITDVQANDYQHAANIVAKMLFGNNAYARRVKGIPYFEDMAGFFQSFRTAGSSPTACGNPFYLQRKYASTTQQSLKKAAIAG